MTKKGQPDGQSLATTYAVVPAGRPSSLLDTRVVYCGDNLAQLAKLPDACVDLIYIDAAPVRAGLRWPLLPALTPTLSRSTGRGGQTQMRWPCVLVLH